MHLSPAHTRVIAPDPRPVISAWPLARWVWGHHRARALLEAPDRGAAPMFGVSTDGCARIAELARLGCRVDTSGMGRLAADEGVAARLDEDAVLVHCRVLGAVTEGLAALVVWAEAEQAPAWDLAVRRWVYVPARNGRPRVYKPEVETHDRVRDPMTGEDRPADGWYAKVWPSPSERDRLDARDEWRRFVAGLRDLVDLLADQPLRRWRVGGVGVQETPWNT